MNETITGFGYPATLLREYRSWVVLPRPAQPTLGSLVLHARRMRPPLARFRRQHSR
jgi:hypothetical protein